MNFEEKMAQMDFYKFSKVQESLLERINQRRIKDNELMDMEELDYVAAAGSLRIKTYPPKNPRN